MATKLNNTRTSERLKPALRGSSELSPSARRCRRKFLKFFPGGFRDETYVDWERGYKWEAYERWCAALRRGAFRSLLDAGDYTMVAKHAVSIESRTNLLFSFEKMALRDAVKSPAGAKAFAEGLWAFLHGSGSDEDRFNTWVETVEQLPRVQTRVLTWPIVTVFGFIAQPERHIFLKPNVTKTAAAAYDFPFEYASRPNWRSYVSLIEFAEQVREDQRDLGPRDMIDLQSFIWVQGSDEY
ncbi:MAG TPA: hypothetical protein VJ867_09845 [Gemmatimonadaceae bacterium]|nr:hypothetical protein [Gemmatimonadaceae bacterium]